MPLIAAGCNGSVVADRDDGDAVVVTYCPLCGTGVAFESHVVDRDLSFGISGLLYNSDVLLYDRETASLWSQLKNQAISGPMRGAMLVALPLPHTTWSAWRRQHPDTRVLSTDTGKVRIEDRLNGASLVKAPYSGGLDSPVSWTTIPQYDIRPKGGVCWGGTQEWRMGYTARNQWNHAEAVQYRRSTTPTKESQKVDVRSI